MALSEVQLNVEWVQQEDRRKYCGPACAQMILRRYGVVRSQDDIWNATRGLLAPQSVGKWYTDPEALAAYINGVPQITASVDVDDVSDASFEFCVGKIARNVAGFEVPTAILVGRGAHWVVVSGLQAEFTSPEKGRVSGLWVADPNSTQEGIEFRPFNSHFQTRWFNNTNVLNDQLWTGKRVVVGEKSADIVDELTIIRQPGGGGGAVDVLEAVDAVIDDVGFFGLGRGEKLLGGGVSNAPTPITFYDTGETYAIAPLLINNDMAWYVFVGDQDGDTFNSTASIMFSDEFRVPPHGDALRKLLASKGYGGKAFTVLDGLYWMECVELSSMFDVVRVVEVQNIRVFITCDGRVLDALHPQPSETALAG